MTVDISSALQTAQKYIHVYDEREREGGREGGLGREGGREGEREGGREGGRGSPCSP